MFAQFKRLFQKASLLATLVSMLAFTVALAASGDLDTTFDGDGKVTNYVVSSRPWIDGFATSIAIQPNGKIVVAGYADDSPYINFAVLRYNADGSIDNTFGGDGRVITNFGNTDMASDVALQANSKIVVAGKSCSGYYCDVALARYNAGGSLDTTFGEDGKQTTDFLSTDNGSDGGLAIQPDGKIVVAGYVHNGTDRDFAVYRYNSDGSLDTTFSGDGRAKFGFGTDRSESAYALALQSDGKIIIVGETFDLNDWKHDRNFALMRLNTDGSLDTTFSGDGRQVTNFGADDHAYSIALQTDGRFVVAGMKAGYGLTDEYIALARYNTDGTLDTTFNSTGKKALRLISGERSWANDVILQADGKIVVLGLVYANKITTGLVRLNSDGALDPTFSADGKVTIDYFGGYHSALALQPSDGKYVLATTEYVDPSNRFALARVLP